MSSINTNLHDKFIQNILKMEYIFQFIDHDY